MKVIIEGVYVDLGSIITITKYFHKESYMPRYNTLRPKIILKPIIKSEDIEFFFKDFSIDNYLEPTYQDKITKENAYYIKKRIDDAYENGELHKVIEEDRSIKIWDKDAVEKAINMYEDEFEEWCTKIIDLWKKADSNIQQITI